MASQLIPNIDRLSSRFGFCPSRKLCLLTTDCVLVAHLGWCVFGPQYLPRAVRFASVPGDLRLARYRHLSRRGVQQFLGRMTLSLASPPSSTDKFTVCFLPPGSRVCTDSTSALHDPSLVASGVTRSSFYHTVRARSSICVSYLTFSIPTHIGGFCGRAAGVETGQGERVVYVDLIDM
ncbi:hypothetical protein DFH06DRAFT_1485656 [Mycena polygramma]|nr:hypothetical protein DFH06DRAFT_1485656 [Mycena polygramma]